MEPTADLLWERACLAMQSAELNGLSDSAKEGRNIGLDVGGRVTLCSAGADIDGASGLESKTIMSVCYTVFHIISNPYMLYHKLITFQQQ